MKYELLQEGDIIKEGDEYWDTRHMRWVRSIESIGRGVGTYDVFRRHITAKPKVRLGELEHSIQLCIDGDLTAKGIAIHVAQKLGIEIEEEKPEWEIALKDYLTNGSIGFAPTIQDKLIAKAMFEAGQACERRKGEK